MKHKHLLLLMIALVAIGLIGYASLGLAAPHTGNVTLKDASGSDIAPGANTPYSPKQTCARACHVSSGDFADFAGHNYESDVALATKNHGAGLPTYQVPYPQHGVTAGYHFQQGRNLDWGDVQREHFHQAEFTSSGGMWGKY